MRAWWPLSGVENPERSKVYWARLREVVHVELVLEAHEVAKLQFPTTRGGGKPELRYQVET